MKARSHTIFVLILIVSMPVIFSNACKLSGKENSGEQGEVILKTYAGNEPAISWNHLTYTIAYEHDQFFSFIGVRALAMTHIAMHDALNAIVPKYQSYAYSGSEPNANPVAAISQAAYEVLQTVYPNKKQVFMDSLQRWLSPVADGEGKTLGIELGKKTAAAILEKRKGDGHDAKGDYTPGTKPGDYQYTPGFDWVWAPDFRFAKPFALNSPDQFRSPPPPALTSEEYEESYKEVKKYGGKNSTARNEDQTSFAHWWAEFGEHSWNRVGRLTAAEHHLHLWETVRMFALINMDLFDIYLASFDSKYYYNSWRPYTAIRMAATDGNPGTEPDPGWEPEMQTPPFPEYPSAHAAVGSGGAAIIAHIYDTPNVPFNMESTMALTKPGYRSYDDLRVAADQCAESRIMNGFHFRFSTNEGKIMGEKVARHLFTHYLQPLDE